VNQDKKYRIQIEDPSSTDATLVLSELSAILKKLTGSSGEASFNIDDLKDEKSIFLLARTENGVPLGCGSLRPMDELTTELKRMYAKESGLGMKILIALEQNAIRLGYKILKLETRKVNERAVSFYLRNGYEITENYGKYVGNDKAICFEKRIG